MHASFLNYEKENNALLQTLKEPHLSNLLSNVFKQSPILLVPQSVSLDGLQLSRSFLEAHLVFLPDPESEKFVSLNGLCGEFKEKEGLVTVKTPPIRENLSDEFVKAWVPQLPPNSDSDDILLKVHILRKSTLNVGLDSLLPITIVSDPLEYDGCSWKKASNELEDEAVDDEKEEELVDGPKEVPVFQALSASGSAFVTAAASSLPVPRKFKAFFTRFAGPNADDMGEDGEASAPEVANTGDGSDTKEGAETTSKDQKEGNGDAEGNGAASEAQENVVIGAPVPTQSVSSPLFTYHHFLEKMKHPTAFELVKSIKNFISFILTTEDMTHEKQAEYVSRYLNDVEQHTRAHPLWQSASEDELDNVREGLEKYLLTRIHKKAFAPTTAEAERDNFLSLRLHALQFLEFEHLEIPPQNPESISRACEELNKMNKFKAPRDKMICILNACKLINNMIFVSRGDGTFGADDFLPIFIYVVLRAQPKDLLLNINYIARYRNPQKLCGEPFYFFTQFESAVNFLEKVDASLLSIDRQEFDRALEEGLEKAKLDVDKSDVAATAPENRDRQSAHPEEVGATQSPTSQETSPQRASPADAARLAPERSKSHELFPTSALPDDVDPRRSMRDVELEQEVLNGGVVRGSPSRFRRVESITEARRALGSFSDVVRNFDRNYRFVNTEPEDLKLGDIPQLLSEYKKIVGVVESLLGEQSEQTLRKSSSANTILE